MKLQDAIEVWIWTTTYAGKFSFWRCHCHELGDAAAHAMRDATEAVLWYRDASDSMVYEDSGDDVDAAPEPPDPQPVAYAEKAGHADTADLAHTATRPRG